MLGFSSRWLFALPLTTYAIHVSSVLTSQCPTRVNHIAYCNGWSFNTSCNELLGLLRHHSGEWQGLHGHKPAASRWMFVPSPTNLPLPQLLFGNDSAVSSQASFVQSSFCHWMSAGVHRSSWVTGRVVHWITRMVTQGLNKVTSWFFCAGGVLSFIHLISDFFCLLDFS